MVFKKEPNAYNEHLTYDSNGNILSLFRYGEVDDPDNVQEIDDLTYEYDDGNKLLKVTDATAHSAGFKDGYTDNDPDFMYDDYGNLIKDRNKGITEISYNHLNLPKKITFENNDYDGTIEYLYDANGTKLKKIVTDNTTNPIAVTTIHYIDGFQYNGNTMDFFPTAEGYVKATHTSGGGIGGGGITYNYVFNYTDHLGNIRLRYAINPVNQWLEILEEDHYYPFGLKHQGYNAENYVFASLGDGPVQLIPTNPNVLESYKYKLNFREYQDEFGLNMYAMDMRQYDPAIARWVVQDPITHYSMSPYSAFDNNPVFWADPSGADSRALVEELWNKSSSGYTRYENTGNGTFEQTAHASTEDIESGKAILVAFPDQNPKIPQNQAVGRWIERNFGDGDGKMQGAGHAGIVIIDGESGLSRYFDFGRYSRPGLGPVPEDHGAVRSSTSFPRELRVSNWDFTKTNEENVMTILTDIRNSPLFEGYGTIMGTLAEGLNFKEMYKYATEMEKMGYVPFGGYSSSTNQNNPTYCAKFARGVAGAGGFNWTWYVLTGKANVDDVNRKNKNGVQIIKN